MDIRWHVGLPSVVPSPATESDGRIPWEKQAPSKSTIVILSSKDTKHVCGNTFRHICLAKAVVAKALQVELKAENGTSVEAASSHIHIARLDVGREAIAEAIAKEVVRRGPERRVIREGRVIRERRIKADAVGFHGVIFGVVLGFEAPKW